MFTKIAIIGTGNMGAWLFKTLQNQNNLSVISISGRKIETLPKDFDLYIFALKDDVYELVLKQISFQMPRAVHTSGSLSQNILAPFAEKYGVLYPYQTVCGVHDAVSGERCAVCGEKHLPDLQSSGLTVSKNALENIKIYPNPTTGELRIENGELRIEKIEISDVYGRKLSSNHLIPTSSHHLINISHLQAGIYFVKIFTEQGEVVKKIIKQ